MVPADSDSRARFLNVSRADGTTVTAAPERNLGASRRASAGSRTVPLAWVSARHSASRTAWLPGVVWKGDDCEFLVLPGVVTRCDCADGPYQRGHGDPGERAG